MNKLSISGHVSQEPQKNKDENMIYFNIGISKDFKNKEVVHESIYLRFITFVKIMNHIAKRVKEGGVDPVSIKYIYETEETLISGNINMKDLEI
jgi:hypothetical protein